MYVDTIKTTIPLTTVLQYIGDKRPHELTLRDVKEIEVDNTGAFCVEFDGTERDNETCHIMVPGKVMQFHVLMSLGVHYMRNAG